MFEQVDGKVDLNFVDMASQSTIQKHSQASEPIRVYRV